MAAPRLGAVEGGGRLAFVRGAGECASGASGCEARPAAHGGDRLLLYATSGPFTCATLLERRVQTDGWLPTRRLREVPAAAAPPLQAWAGDWRGLGDDHIHLAPRRSGRLRIDAGAYWPARNPPPGAPGPHFGGMAGDAEVAGADATYQEGPDPQACRTHMTLMRPYLVVRDNGACGALNVSFTGVYRRR